MEPGDLVMAIITGFAAIVALIIGLIALYIQIKASKERNKQEEYKANKLRFQISPELDKLRELYERLQDKADEEKVPIIVYTVPNEYEETLHTLNNLYCQHIMLEMREIITLELIIDTTRVLVKDYKIKTKAINETLNYINVLKNEI